MVEFKNECVGCPPEMGCLGTICPNRNVPHFYCDKCKEEVDPDDTYNVDDKLFCLDCLRILFKVPAEHWLKER